VSAEPFDEMDGQGFSGFFEPRRKNEFPAQAQVAAWARGGKPRVEPGRLRMLGRPVLPQQKHAGPHRALCAFLGRRERARELGREPT
jgi:hypothetical protein